MHSEGLDSLTVESAKSGWARMYYIDSDKTWRYKDSLGVVRIFAVGVTAEYVQDLLSNSFNDTDSIKWTYNDAANNFEAVVDPAILTSLTTVISWISNHISATNPHNIDHETTAQLNARDLANRNRINHSGTQLAATISDLKTFIDNYLDRNFDQNANESINTTTTMANRFNFPFVPKNTAVYMLTMNFAHSHDTNGVNMETELLVDGVIVDDMEYEAKDSAGTEGGSGTDQKQKTTLKYLIAMTALTSYQLSFRYRSEDAGVESTIKSHSFTYERYMP